MGVNLGALYFKPWTSHLISQKVGHFPNWNKICPNSRLEESHTLYRINMWAQQLTYRATLYTHLIYV